jgi:AGCS family alanine or glycine:cation symporter
VLSACVGAVILGGVSSIVRVSAAIAPSMVALYVGAGLIILLIHPLDTLDSLRSVFFYAFHPDAVVGGVSGYVAFRSLQYGISRGIFSHGSGVGMAPFFQAANTDHPLRGAFMAAAIPVVDTLIVCTITGLVILSHGFWQVWTSAHLTVSSFEAVLGASGKLVVFACLAVFAFTTMISWAHFSERCYAYLGGRNVGGYRLFFCGVTFCGPFLSVAFVWSMADVLMGSLLFVHLLALTVIATMRAPTILRDFG